MILFHGSAGNIMSITMYVHFLPTTCVLVAPEALAQVALSVNIGKLLLALALDGGARVVNTSQKQVLVSGNE
jgi:hypothetical protein